MTPTIKDYTFNIEQNDISLKHFMERYHFDEKDVTLVHSTGVFLSNFIQAKAYVIYQKNGIICSVTLGNAYDQLESLVMESGNLLLSYCLECYGMEFLSKTYERINETVHEETNQWLDTYQFLDCADETHMKEILSSFYNEFDMDICLQKGMLHPLKSVIFTSNYTSDKINSGCHNCDACHNLTCNFRNNGKQRGLTPFP